MSGWLIFGLVCAGIPGLIGLTIAFSKARKRRKNVAVKRRKAEEQRQQDLQFEALLPRAEAGDRGAQRKLMDYSSHEDAAKNARLKKIQKKVRARDHAKAVRVEMRSVGEEVRESFAAWQAAADTAEEIRRLEDFIRKYGYLENDENKKILAVEFGLTKAGARELLPVRVVAIYERLVASFYDNRQDFLDLQDLIRRTEDYTDNLRYHMGVSPLPYPQGWDDAMAKHMRNPAFRDFAPGRDVHPGELRLMAADALRTEDIVGIKLALAYANNSRDYYREELGDVLTAELAKAVAAYHGEDVKAAELAEEQ